METCHYCSDTIDKFCNDYDKLYKEIQLADSIIKKNNYIHVLSEIDMLFETYSGQMAAIARRASHVTTLHISAVTFWDGWFQFIIKSQHTPHRGGTRWRGLEGQWKQNLIHQKFKISKKV